MQSLAAYSFQAKIEDTAQRLIDIDNLVDEWLKHKGATNPRLTDGDFNSKTGDGTGQFARNVVTARTGSTREIQLLEAVSDGAIFTTT